MAHYASKIALLAVALVIAISTTITLVSAFGNRLNEDGEDEFMPERPAGSNQQPRHAREELSPEDIEEQYKKFLEEEEAASGRPRGSGPQNDDDADSSDSSSSLLRNGSSKEPLMLLWFAPFLGVGGYGSEALEFASSVHRATLPAFNHTADESAIQPTPEHFAIAHSARIRRMEKAVKGEDDDDGNDDSSSGNDEKKLTKHNFTLATFGCFHHGDVAKIPMPDYHTEEFLACARTATALAFSNPVQPHQWPGPSSTVQQENDERMDFSSNFEQQQEQHPASNQRHKQRKIVIDGKRKSATETALVHPSRIIAVCHSNQGMWSLPRPDFPTIACPPRNVPVRAIVGRTMFETDRLPLTWNRRMMQMDEIWVPTEFHKKAFSRPDWPGSIPAEKMRVMPEPIDTELWRIDDTDAADQFMVPFGFGSLRVPTHDRMTRSRIAGLSMLSRIDLTPANLSDPLFMPEPGHVENLRRKQNFDPFDDDDADNSRTEPSRSLNRDAVLRTLKGFKVSPPPVARSTTTTSSSGNSNDNSKYIDGTRMREFSSGTDCFYSRIFLSTFKRERRKGWDVLVRAFLEAFPAMAVTEQKRTIKESKVKLGRRWPVCLALHTAEFAEEVPLDFPETIQLFVDFVYAKNSQIGNNLLEQQERLQQHETKKAKEEYQRRMKRYEYHKATKEQRDRFAGAQETYNNNKKPAAAAAAIAAPTSPEEVAIARCMAEVMPDLDKVALELEKYFEELGSYGIPFPINVTKDNVTRVVTMQKMRKALMRECLIERQEQAEQQDRELAEEEDRVRRESRRQQQQHGGGGSSSSSTTKDSHHHHHSAVAETATIGSSTKISTLLREEEEDPDVVPSMRKLPDRISAARMAFHQRAEMAREIRERHASYRQLCLKMCAETEDCVLCEDLVGVSTTTTTTARNTRTTTTTTGETDDHSDRRTGTAGEGEEEGEEEDEIEVQAESWRAFMRGRIRSRNIPAILFTADRGNKPLSFLEYKRLITVSDVNVLATRGEGWARPVQEAMALGIPSIVTNWSGPASFSREEFAFLIPIDERTQLREVPDDLWFSGGHKWAEPSVDDLRALLLKALRATRTTLDEMGGLAREYVVKNLDVSVVGKMVAEAVADLAAKTKVKL